MIKATTKLFNAYPLGALKLLLTALMITLNPWSLAIADVRPDAGSILQQMQQVAPAKPSSNDTSLNISRPAAAKLPMTETFEVKVIELGGNHAFSTELLQTIVVDALGTKITLPQLGALATRITDYYHSHGYPLTRAYIPAQTIATGIVRIEILEAHYGTINLDNHSHVKDSLLHSTLAPLQSGQPVAQSNMDSALLLLSDIPGISNLATLKPGTEVGSSDLDVKTEATPRVSGNLSRVGLNKRHQSFIGIF